MVAADSARACLSSPSVSRNRRQRSRSTLRARLRSRKARARKRPGGRRLFAFDRELGCRFVAGADEAGRGSLAGPLVAAAVLFDLERLTLSDRRALARLNDSKQHTEEAREELYPLVLRAAARSVIVSRCVRGIDSRGLHVTNLDALRTALLRCRARGHDLPGRRLPRARVRLRAARGGRRRLPQRRDRRRVGARQGDARPLHAHAPPSATRAGTSTPTSATRRPSTARRSRRTGSRRSTGMSFQSIAYTQLALGQAIGVAGRWLRGS